MKRNQVEDEPLQKRGFFFLQSAHYLDNLYQNTANLIHIPDYKPIYIC